MGRDRRESEGYQGGSQVGSMAAKARATGEAMEDLAQEKAASWCEPPTGFKHDLRCCLLMLEPQRGSTSSTSSMMAVLCH
eukprot:Skav221278  [mRNA]  locus=scaffold2775:86872:87111:+ [translate_table: standard]